MDVPRRNLVLFAFLFNFVNLVLIIIAFSGNWVASTIIHEGAFRNGSLEYGLFGGTLTQFPFSFSSNKLYMTCVRDVDACALSCKTTSEAREQEVRMLAEGYRPDPSCGNTVHADVGTPSAYLPVISYTFYSWLIVVLSLQLVFIVISAGLIYYNSNRIAKKKIYGIRGCIWLNKVTSLLGLVVVTMFGINWIKSGLRYHVAQGYVAHGLFQASPYLAFSYWVVVVSIFCALLSSAVLKLRQYKINNDPPPPPYVLSVHPLSVPPPFVPPPPYDASMHPTTKQSLRF